MIALVKFAGKIEVEEDLVMNGQNIITNGDIVSNMLITAVDPVGTGFDEGLVMSGQVTWIITRDDICLPECAKYQPLRRYSGLYFTRCSIVNWSGQIHDIYNACFTQVAAVYHPK